MIIKSFLGINNVADPTRLSAGEMTQATNVDIGERNDLRSRRGRTILFDGAAHSAFGTSFGTLVVVDSDLVLLDDAGTLLRTVYPALGYTRVWYDTLPDGRVAFSNGLINGLVTAAETRTWGVPIPVDAGVGISGNTPYMVTYVRLSDGLESAPLYGNRIDVSENIIGLPVLGGHAINVYFAPYGEAMFLAGTTATDTYVPTGGALGPQYVGSGLGRPPIGTQIHVWAGIVLVADGNVLWSTRPLQPELCDLTQDFVQLPHPITLVYGVNEGVFVGTTEGMYFLVGTAFGDLKSQSIASGPVTLGSMVEFDLSYLSKDVRPSGVDQGALCLIDSAVHLLFGGRVVALTAGRYRMVADEVVATVRLRDGVLQYLASPV